MARTKVVEGEGIDPALVQEAEELAALNEQEGGELFAAIDELREAAGVTCIVSRTAQAGNGPATLGYVITLPVSAFSREKIAKVCGAGRYKVQIKGPKGFLPGGGPVLIAEGIEQPKPAGGSDFMTFMEFQRQQDADRESKRSRLLELAIPALGTALAGWLARPNTPQGPDIGNLIAALKPPPGPTLSDLSTVMVNMQSLAAPKGGESTVDTVLRVFEAARDLAGDKEEGGSKGGASSWVDVIRDLIKVAPEAIKPVLQARMDAMQKTTVQQTPPALSTAPVAAPSAAPFVPASTPNPPSVSTAVNIPPSGNEMLNLLMPVIREHLAKVAAWAEKNRDPETYADVFLDELPDNAGQYFSTQQVLDYLNHAQWFEVVSGIEPRLVPHQAWCNELREELVAIFQEEVKKELSPQAAPSQPIHEAENSEGAS